jgi:hypothetical protein
MCTFTGAEARNKWPQLLLKLQPQQPWEHITAVIAAADPCCNCFCVTQSFSPLRV